MARMDEKPLPFRFSLRTLLVAVALVAGVLAIVAPAYRWFAKATEEFHQDLGDD